MLAANRSKSRSGAVGVRHSKSSRRGDWRWFHPRLEPLEDRRLLSLMPVMVRDIGLVGVGSDPTDLTDVNGTLFFSADDGNSGPELWKCDGTEAGTVRVKDILPGNDDSYLSYLTNVNGTLFFEADDGTTGRELWKSDGTEAGTVRVKDIRPGNLYSYPRYLTNVDGTLFFTADDGTSGQELWKSDGTEAGTVRVKDIMPGIYGSDPRALTNVNETLFFYANDGTSGRELWTSDGTEAGTVRARDIRPGRFPFFTGPDFLTSVNGTLFFQADDGTSGRELWTSDGTEAGTVLVKDIRPGRYGSYPLHVTNVNGTLFFFANDGTSGLELWKSDGTEAGTVRVKDIRPGGDGSLGHGREPLLTNVNGTLFFRANDGASGPELWQSDGTEAGTVRVKDIRPGSDEYGSGIGSGLDYLTNVNGTLFFAAVDGTSGRELWQSDGTEAGTALVKDILPGSDGAVPYSLTNVNGTLFFRADDGVHGTELWKLAPTPGDTNYDGVVDITDLNNDRNNFGRAGSDFPGDTTGNGVVDIDDLNAVRNNFGAGAPAAASLTAPWMPGKVHKALLPLVASNNGRLESPSDDNGGLESLPHQFGVPRPKNDVRRASRGHELIRAWDEALEMDVAAVVVDSLETVAAGATTR